MADYDYGADYPGVDLHEYRRSWALQRALDQVRAETGRVVPPATSKIILAAKMFEDYLKGEADERASDS